MRALQLPEEHLPGGEGDLKLTRELQEAAQQRADERWIDLVTGPCVYARLYLAVTTLLLSRDAVVIEQLDASGAVVIGQPLGALSPVFVTGTTGLPPRWLDPAGPWSVEVDAVATLLDDPSLAGLVRLLVSFEARAETVRLRIRVTGHDPRSHPAVVLVVAEVLAGAENERFATEEHSRSGQVETLAGYLGGTAAVPLLTPDTIYTLHVDYVPTAEDQRPDAPPVVTVFNTVTESFRFTTDKDPPARLDAYVLATSPRHEEQFVFADDAIEIVFNDLQVVQLYQKYGRTLTAVLRGADGIAIPAHQVADLSEVPATYTSPLYDTLDAKVKAGGLGCIGSYHHEGHAKFTLPEALRPSMAYTLDIEAQPVPAPPAGKPIVPLFRRQFRTGRFRSLDELAGEMRARSLEHRLLTGPITGLSPGEATDLAIEAALLAAGVPVLGAATLGSRMVLWRPRAGGFVPHALVLDTSEPLWRFRDAPTQEVVPNADPLKPPPDPAFQRIIPGRELSLKLEAASPVTGFVRSPAGTRTIVLLADAAWPSGGATVTIDAVRTASTLYGITERRVTVTTLPLGGHAPWEGDDA
jgi:large repetitive protein